MQTRLREEVSNSGQELALSKSFCCADAYRQHDGTDGEELEWAARPLNISRTYNQTGVPLHVRPAISHMILSTLQPRMFLHKLFPSILPIAIIPQLWNI